MGIRWKGKQKGRGKVPTSSGMDKLRPGGRHMASQASALENIKEIIIKLIKKIISSDFSVSQRAVVHVVFYPRTVVLQ